MKELLKNELLLLSEKYYLQKNCQFSEDDFGSSWVYDLDHELRGVAKYVKILAYELEDMELLGIATKIELDLQKDIDNRIKELDYELEMHNKDYQNASTARRFCIQWFYKENRYSVDMSRYKSIINENENMLQKAGLYDRLVRYIDEKKLLDKIYNQVKMSLTYNSQCQPPEVTEADELFNTQLQIIYRNANNHICKQLKKANNFVDA